MALRKRLEFVWLCSTLVVLLLFCPSRIEVAAAQGSQTSVSQSEKEAVKSQLKAFLDKWGKKWCEGGWSGCGIVPLNEFNGLLASLNAVQTQAQLDWVRFMTLSKDQCLMKYIGDKWAGELRNCLSRALQSTPWPVTMEPTDQFPDRCPYCHKRPCGRRCWDKKGFGHGYYHTDGVHRFKTKDAYYCATGGEPPRSIEEVKPSSLEGTWNWTARCPMGNFSGQFVIDTHEQGGALAGEFLGAHHGSLEGQASKNQIRLIRRFSRTQQWVGTLSKGSGSGWIIKGKVSDPTHEACAFTASKSY